MGKERSVLGVFIWYVLKIYMFIRLKSLGDQSGGIFVTSVIKIFNRDVTQAKSEFMTSRGSAVTSEVRGCGSCYFYLFEFR